VEPSLLASTIQLLRRHQSLLAAVNVTIHDITVCYK